MTKKLTLTLDDNIIENARKYAAVNHTSISKLVEFYFKSITNQDELILDKIPPITNELTGIAGLKTDKSDKTLLVEALIKQHLG